MPLTSLAPRLALVFGLVLLLPAIAVPAPAGNVLPQGIGTGPITFDHYVSPNPGSAGETSIGINPHTNTALFIRLTKVDRVTWDDRTSPPTAHWADVTPVFSTDTFDPILWTDRASGKTYAVQLLLAANEMIMTQGLANPVDGSTILPDGDQWALTEPASTFPFFDHETLGGGPHALVPGTLPTADPNVIASGLVPGADQVTGQLDALYVCGQLGTAVCMRSDDDGVTWGPYVPINLNDDCGGLTGHVVVDHSGTVYVPIDFSNSGQQCVEVSTTNGVTWTTHKIPGSQNGRSDPAIAVDAADNVYFAMTSGGRPKVSVSHDHGATWSSAVDVAPGVSIANTEFSMMVAGDAGRAAMAYYGTDTPGNDQSSGFAGRWHLYVSFTFDGGATWQNVDTTPDVSGTGAVQVGCIWLQGGGNPCRNLLDFQGATLDAQGRVVVGYADGCTASRCGPNGGSSVGTIARQTTGKTLYAAYDG